MPNCSLSRWLRSCSASIPGPAGCTTYQASADAFPYLPGQSGQSGQSGYNKRLHKALPLLKRAIREPARDTDLWADPVWVADSTPVECGRSRPTTRRWSWPAGSATATAVPTHAGSGACACT